MKKIDLNASQLRDINLFNMILECYGWEDLDDVEGKLEEGQMVNPEGSRVLRNTHTLLHAKFHAPVNMISLLINDRINQESVQFHFLYDLAPERILEWIATTGEELTLEKYPELLKGASGKCEMILLEVSDSEIYEVKPPAGA